jgi:hypothetical protein
MAASIENLIAKFEAVAPAQGQRWNVDQIVKGRLHLTRSADGHFGIFLEGALGSFGPLPAFDELQHSDDVRDLSTDRRISALRIRCVNEANSSRILAHIAYELEWRLDRNPKVENSTLIRDVGWLLNLIGKQRTTMVSERQKGLVGECLFLRLLLLRCHSLGQEVQSALDAWTGHDASKRDYYRPGIAVEAKATGNATRLHHISSLDQLSPQTPEEKVFLFSVGIRQDTTAPKKLTHFIADIENLLVDANGNADVIALDSFRSKVRAYGFDSSLVDLYEREPGFLAPHLPPLIFNSSDLRALSATDFVGGGPPETVRSVSYALEVMAEPLSEAEVFKVIDELLGLQSIG